MISKIAMGSFFAVAMARSYFNVWGDAALDLTLTLWGAR